MLRLVVCTMRRITRGNVSGSWVIAITDFSAADNRR
jgi:hypothetical protein